MPTAPNQMERQSPSLTKLYWAKRSLGYGDQQLGRGQVFKLRGLPNDRLLVDLGYVALVEDQSAQRFPCRVCGAEFMEQRMRDSHGKSVHEEKPYVPPPPPVREPGESKDAYQNRLDAWAQQAGTESELVEERKLAAEDAAAPLDLTKTSASRS